MNVVAPCATELHAGARAWPGMAMVTAPTTPPKLATTDDPGAAALLAVVRTLRKHWPVVVASALLSTGLSVLYARSQPKVYQSTSMVELNARASQPLGEKGNEILAIGEGLFEDPREYYETQYKIITSDRVLNAVVRDQSLTADADFLGYVPTPDSPATVEAATNHLRGEVSVEPIKYSRLAQIRVEDRDPKRARRLCDAVASAYIDQNLQTALAATSDSVEWLGGQVDHIGQDLESNENKLYKFKQDNDLPSTSINEASNMLRLEMQEFDTSLTRTRTRKQELLARHAVLAQAISDDPDRLPASEFLSSGYLQTLRKQYEDALHEKNDAVAEGKGENHPLVRKAAEKISQTRQALLDEVRNIQGAVERDLAVVTKEESGIAELFEATRRRAVELNMKEIEYHRLDRAREQNEKLYAMLLERLKQTDLARMMKVNNIRVVDTASDPHAPIRPRVGATAAVGFTIGILLGVALAWIREQLDNSVKTPDDLEKYLGVTFLGLLPAFEEDGGQTQRNGGGRRRRRRNHHKAPAVGVASVPELFVHDHPMSNLAEAARSIRTNLTFMSPDRPFRKILVTSAAPFEGKTTVACSVAIAFAQSGQRVCIVDCDLRRPRLHRIFGLRGHAGVTNVLVGEATIEEVASETTVKNLYAITSGPIPPNPADMLHSDRFRRFLTELSERFDRVVIDSPPLAPVTDSAIVSTLVDGTLFVVRAFATARHLSAQGLRALRDVDAPVMGAVLNAVDMTRGGYGGYYHYYYYYRKEGYGPSPEAPRDDSAQSAAPN